MEDIEELSYPALDAKIEKHFPDLTESRRSVVEWPAYAMLAVALLMTAVSKHFPLWFLLSALCLELLGCVWIVFVSIRRDAFEFFDAKKKFAGELEQHFHGYEEIIGWLRLFSNEQLEFRLTYTRLRRESITQRLGVMAGGIEKLGFLPVLAVLYVQLKDFTLEWPPPINVAAAAVGGLLAGGYAASLMGASLRFRLNLYEHLIEEALKSGSRRSLPPASSAAAAAAATRR